MVECVSSVRVSIADRLCRGRFNIISTGRKNDSGVFLRAMVRRSKTCEAKSINPEFGSSLSGMSYQFFTWIL